MNEWVERRTAVEAMAARVALGCWLAMPQVPWWQAIGRRAEAQVPASVVGAVHLVAQTRASRDDVQREALGRLTAEVIEDLCGADAPPRAWDELSRQLEVLSAGYPQGSLLRDATEDLRRRVLARLRQ